MLQPLCLGLEIVGHAGELRVSLRILEILGDLAPFLGELVGRLELLQAPTRVSRRVSVREDGRVGHPLLRLCVRAFELRNEIFHGRHDPERVVGSVRPER